MRRSASSSSWPGLLLLLCGAVLLASGPRLAAAERDMDFKAGADRTSRPSRLRLRPPFARRSRRPGAASKATPSDTGAVVGQRVPSVAGSLVDIGDGLGSLTLSAATGRGRYRSRAVVAAVAAADAPALQAFLSQIDEKMHPIKHPRWSPQECAGIAGGVVKAHSGTSLLAATASRAAADNTSSANDGENSATTGHQVFVHTGVFLSDLGGTSKWKDAETKLRLGVLSFLATQSPGHSKLVFWTDVSPDNPLLQRALGPILADGNFSKRVQVRTFDPEAEFRKLAPGSSDVLLRMYMNDTMLASRSDLFRVAILHNYGGMWVDTDVLLVRDLAPLEGEDFAYLGQAGFINNAVLSVSRPGSPFVASYLATVAAHGLASMSGNVYQFGPALLGELFRNIVDRGTFHVLPTCFFDGGWSGEAGAVSWDGFFTGSAHAQEVAYVTPRSDPASETTFAYHWHGRWDKPIAHGSLADVMYRFYVQRLGLQSIVAAAPVDASGGVPRYAL